MNHVVVTGGAGVIGSLFVRRVLDTTSAHVTVIDRGSDPRHAWNIRTFPTNRVTIYPQNLAAGPILRAVLADWIDGADLCLHAAASTGIPWSGDHPTADWADNVDGTLTLVEALRICKWPPPTVMLSSVKPYAVDETRAEDHPTRYEPASFTEGYDEHTTLVPDEPYAASKAAQSMIGMAWARSFRLPITVLRCSNLYGPAACHGPRHGWLTWACICATIGIQFDIQGSGKQTRDMLFHTDLETAVLAAAAGISRTRGNVYNIGGGRTNIISVVEAVAAIREIMPLQTGAAPARKADDQLFCTDWSLFHTVTEWTPEVSPRSGIQRVLDWACKNADALRTIYAGDR